MRSRSYATFFLLGVTLGVTAVAQPAAAAPTPVVAQYSFDGRNRAGDDSGNGHTMRLLTRRGGTVRPVVHGTGQGLQFPPRCAGARCPHAVLQSPHSAELNPGARNLEFGATVRLAADQTSNGQNVVQKGYSATSSQYKLQIDGRAGHPSCVLVDIRRRGIRQVTSAISVADGTWHTVTCRRQGAVLSILVDYRLRGVTRIPVDLILANNHPLSIGGKGTYFDNDQYRGAVDDVFVRIG
jgi:hypothetical protein